MAEKSDTIKGRITKALGGFYYVHTEKGLYECRARGSFRNDKITPYVGDIVTVELTEEDRGYILGIDERKNFLIRPPVANIDCLMIVISTVSPAPNPLIIDKMLAIAEYKGIEPVLVVTKTDIGSAEELMDTYRKVGYRIYGISSETGEGIAEVKKELAGKLTAFTGNSGVGKSSLLNAIDNRFSVETGEISEKLGRGRHTTRHVELFDVCGGFVVDTPGFSSVEMNRFAIIKKDELQNCFVEFEKYIPLCKFTGCSHTKEKSCAIVQAVELGEIAVSRHESYLALYEDAKKINDWDERKN